MARTPAPRGSGIRISRNAHQIRNPSSGPRALLVISQPPSHGDRIDEHRLVGRPPQRRLSAILSRAAGLQPRLLVLRSTPAARSAPRTRAAQLRAQTAYPEIHPSAARKLSPYPYHQTFFIPGMRSISRYFTRTISSSPKRPCVRPTPLAFTPPCGASLMPKHEITSFTITVPA